jgi:hypothetical protein
VRAPYYTLAMADQEAYLNSLKEENTAMEQEIARLTKREAFDAPTAADATKAAPSAAIRVMDFGRAKVADDAGTDHGSAWCPPQCHRRTGLGARAL